MSNAPPRLADALKDRYLIERELGSGGMATVYLAHDLRHERQVALKVLNPELAAVIGGDRFLAEIKTTANLHHPHILPLFDSGEADGFLFYVMPYVEGESLRDRLDREHQLPVDDAVQIATNVAEALDYAHGRGVIHRDIKPANILLQGGKPVVSDFGIALAVGEAGRGSRLTETGFSLGTPHYMSPEQATGDAHLGAGTDVWALGCILYEMLTGEPPYVGTTVQAVLGRVLTSDAPSASGQRPTVPTHVDSVVLKALEKLPADRFGSAGNLAAALSDPGFTHVRGGAASAAGPAAREGRGASRPGVSRLLAATTIGLALLSAVLWVTRGENRPGALAAPVAFVAQASDSIGTVAVAADGTVAWLDGGTLLIRPPGSVEARPVPGLEGAVEDFSWSPDGRTLAVVQEEGIVTIALQSGLRTTILPRDAVVGLGTNSRMRWADDGWIYLSVILRPGGRILRVPQAGGSPEEVLRVDRPSDPLANFVFFLSDYIPDGGGLLLTMSPGVNEGSGLHPQVVHHDLDSGDLTGLVADSAASGTWSATGHVVYARTDGSLWALPWDRAAGRPASPAVRVGEGVEDASFRRGPPRLALGPTGTLAYLQGVSFSSLFDEFEVIDGAVFLELLAVDGSVTALELPATDHPDASVSRDGRFVAYTRGGDLRIFDRQLGTEEVLATDPDGQLHDPVWSPDGRALAYWMEENRIAIQPADGSESPRMLTATDDSTEFLPTQWLDDGTLLIYPRRGSADLVAVIPADGTGSPRPLFPGGQVEFFPVVSPDEEWIAFFGTRSDGTHLFVRRWPELDGEIQLTPVGTPLSTASRMAWTSDSRGIVFVTQGFRPELGGSAPAYSLLTFDPSAEGEVSPPRPLGLALPGGRIRGSLPDGRILVLSQGVSITSLLRMTSRVGAGAGDRLVVVANWFTLLRQRESAADGGQ